MTSSTFPIIHRFYMVYIYLLYSFLYSRLASILLESLMQLIEKYVIPKAARMNIALAMVIQGLE